MSPERLDPRRFGFKDGRATKESDCYALGMVVLEVLTGQPPFPHYNDITVVRKVVDGERPMRPQGPESVWFTDDLWGMLERCWSPQLNVRPTAEAILGHLERASMSWRLLHPTADNFRQTTMAGFDCTLQDSTSGITQETINTTEKRIALIAQGSLDSERASQLLDEIFDAQDYLTVLREYSEAQQYIDGLYKVYCSCFCKSPFHLGVPLRLLVTCPLVHQHAGDASGHSGGQGEKPDYFQPVIMFHSRSRNKARCRSKVGGSQKFGRRMTPQAPLLRSRSFVSHRKMIFPR